MWQKLKDRFTKQGNQNCFIVLRRIKIEGEVKWIFMRWVYRYRKLSMYNHGDD